MNYQTLLGHVSALAHILDSYPGVYVSHASVYRSRIDPTHLRVEISFELDSEKAEGPPPKKEPLKD